MGTCYLAADLVKGLLGLTLFATTGGEKTTYFPFKLLDLLEGISMGVGSATGETYLS
jgi:hypothetical protein